MQTDIDYSVLPAQEKKSSAGKDFANTLLRTIVIIIVLSIVGMIYAAIVGAVHLFHSTNLQVAFFIVVLIALVVLYLVSCLRNKAKLQQGSMRKFAEANGWAYQGPRKIEEFSALFQKAFGRYISKHTYVICSVRGSTRGKEFELLFLRSTEYIGRSILLHYITIIRTKQSTTLQTTDSSAMTGMFDAQQYLKKDQEPIILTAAVDGYGYVMTDSNITTQATMQSLFDRFRA